MLDETYHRNVEVDDLLQIWEWCSRHLRIKWQHRPKLGNGCFIGLACALSDSEDDSIAPFDLIKGYKSLPRPLLDRDQVIAFWDARPVSLLELCLGSYTKTSPLTKSLNRVRPAFQDNPRLDELSKKMRCREKQFGDDWHTEGHHPDREVRLLKKEMKPLCERLRDLIADQPDVVGKLSLEVLAKGWHFGEIPASWRVRRTPEKLLNRTTRLKLWQAAQDVLSRRLGEEAKLDALCQALYRKITPSTKAAIEAQGYTIDNVVDDMLNFDMRKSREEITA